MFLKRTESITHNVFPVSAKKTCETSATLKKEVLLFSILHFLNRITVGILGREKITWKKLPDKMPFPLQELNLASVPIISKVSTLGESEKNIPPPKE
ncbi:MAG: hypothetical protein KGS48_08945 [Bacteroidetes bacterium]|nr:hypothetical protein [Bacteroidota bacterium]